MRELKMFMFEGCPHCKRAEQMIESLLAAHPEYKEVPFVRIDEKKEPELADKYGLRGGLQRLGGAPC